MADHAQPGRHGRLRRGRRGRRAASPRASAISPGAGGCCRSARCCCFLLLWWQAVEQLDIKPFIAPSPVAVAQVLVDRFGMLMTNLAADGDRGGMRLPARQLRRHQPRHGVRLSQDRGGGALPDRGDGQHHPGGGQGADPGAAAGQRHGAQDRHRRASSASSRRLVNMTRGLRDVRPEQLELMRILSATPREVFWQASACPMRCPICSRR